MKKADKIVLAKECHAQNKELNLNVEIKKDILQFNAPTKVPTNLLINLTQCGEYIVELIKNEDEISR